jgi:hypothetical protein
MVSVSKKHLEIGKKSNNIYIENAVESRLNISIYRNSFFFKFSFNLRLQWKGCVIVVCPHLQSSHLFNQFEKQQQKEKENQSS